MKQSICGENTVSSSLVSPRTRSLSLATFLLFNFWPFFVKCSLKVRFAFIHPLGSHLLLNHLKPRHPPGHQPDKHGQVLCALCFSLQPLAAWNSSRTQEKCPTQDVPWDRVQMLGCSLLCSDGPKTGSRSCLCHLQYRDATCALISLKTPMRAVFAAVFWTQELNLRTAKAAGVSKRVMVSKPPTTTLKIWLKKQSASRISVIIC